LDGSAASFDASMTGVDASIKGVDPSTVVVDASLCLVDPSMGLVDPSNRGVDPSTVVVAAAMAIVDRAMAVVARSENKFFVRPGLRRSCMASAKADHTGMRTVPETRLGKIEFYESRLGPWAASGAAIGLAIDSILALAAKTAAARAAYDTHLAAAAAARAATTDFYQTVTAMHGDPGAGSDMIATIRNYAQVQDDPEVYTLAQIPPPASPGTPPPPGVPTDFGVELLASGALSLTWKSRNPRGVGGTIYELVRQVDGGAFTFVGSTGSRVFTDDTVPAGAAAVTYQITAVRSTARGKPARHTVRFGGAGNETGTGVALAA
jgi:hypothetical protein